MTHIVLKLSVVLVVLFGVGFEYIQGVDGLCSLEHCTNNATCAVSKDLKSCKCVQGYYGDHCDKSALVHVVCERDSITVRALESYFTYYNVPLESLHLPNKSCRAQRELIQGVPFYTAKVSKEEYFMCGGRPLKKNITHIAYSLSLMSDPRTTGNVIREPVVKLDFKCVFPYIRKITLKHPVVPFASETVMRVDELEATIQMLLYKDQSYTEAYSSAPTIGLGDDVYVELMVTEPADFFLLRINECWATQSPEPNSTEEYVHSLLLNGCVKDETVSFLNESNRDFGNGKGSVVRYSFDMFRFAAETYDVYLHCTVQICEPEEHRTCTPNCNSIFKREAIMIDRTHGLLSYGPIKLEVPDRPLSNILTTVVLPVAAVWTVGFFLVSLIMVAKAGNKRILQTDN